MRVVIVVPSFAESHQSHPPVVARIVARGEPAPTPHVRGGVHQPGGMQAEHDAEKTRPQQKGESTNGKQQHCRTTEGTQ